MIDADIRLSMRDGKRRFDLDVRVACDAPCVALYGPSGAGKSLTMQALAGLLRPSSGHIRIGGRTVFDAATGVDLPSEARQVGYVFQHYALFPHLSVRDNVAFGLTSWRSRQLDKSKRQRVLELLDALQISELADGRPATLSGGQQQRVALARALACEPTILLLDEPFAALNPILRTQLRGELREVQRRFQVPMVMVTHDVDDVVALADRVIVIDGGTVRDEIDLHARNREPAPFDAQAGAGGEGRAAHAWLRAMLAIS